METFDAGNGRTLSYVRRGTGPLVVCIPGGPGFDPEAYFATMELPGYELLILAPRGTGRSTPPPDPSGYRIAGYVADVESLREHLGADQLTLYGNSHGGCTALAYAGRQPDRVTKFVVANGPPRMDDAFRQAQVDARARFAQRLPGGSQRLTAADEAEAVLDGGAEGDERERALRTFMARYVAEQGQAETEYLDRLCAAPMNWEAVEVMYAEFTDGLDLLRDAGQIIAPALVIAGELDVTVPASQMQVLADTLPDAAYVELPGVGHFVEVEAGEELRRVVTDFLG